MRKSAKVKGAAAMSRRASKKNYLPVVVFLLPTLLVLILYMAYPIIFTIIRSFYDAAGSYIGLDNYRRIINEPRMLVALRNNAIWVAVVPVTITGLGLVLAVLTEKIKWSRAFKVALFMPLVVSGLAAGVTFRFMYASDPDIGFINAAAQSVVHVFRPPGLYPGARPSTDTVVIGEDGSYLLNERVEPGEQANFGMLAIRPNNIPDTARGVRTQSPIKDGISGVVWLDFKRGGGTRGMPEEGESGLPGVRVELFAAGDNGGQIVGTAYTGADGGYSFKGLEGEEYVIRLSESSFRLPFGGFYWLGPRLIIPSLIIAYIWIATGLALIIIGAGLSAINRDYMDAARVAGASEFQVLRYLTIPLLKPILLVVLVRTIISVLKIFDLVMVIAPESVQADATVLALEMWRASFGGMRDFGLGSALAAILFLLILPVVVSNVRRFRFE